MTPNDVLYLEALATIATLSVAGICLILYRAAQRFDEKLSPLVDDLQAGASGFREAGQVAVHGANFAWSLLVRKAFTLFGR